MNIVVCLKQVLDPDVPARDFRIAPSALEADPSIGQLVTSIFCANALETALQFRDRFGGKITTLTFAGKSGEEVLRKSLALRADQAVWIENPTGSNPDPLLVARALAAGIRRLDPVDLILVGRESADWGAGQTGGLLAEELGFPCLCFVDRIDEVEGHVVVRRQTESGRERYRLRLPIVLTITNDDQNVPRSPKTKDVLLSGRQPITRWSLADVGLAPSEETYSQIKMLSLPERKSQCEFIQGESLDERIKQLAQRIAQSLPRR